MKQNQRMKKRNIVFAMILSWLVCLGPLQRAQAIVTAPDYGCNGGKRAEGHAALLSLTVSSCDAALGLFSRRSNTGDNFNTAIGAGAFLANISAENTGSGAGLSLSDIIVSLLILPWLVRALASAKAIWRALTDSQKSGRKRESWILADS
jgi:hypothetical protein